MTRILYVGNFTQTWCTEVHVARDAETILGVTVDRMQESRDGGEQFLDEIEARAENADLVLYTKTWGLNVRANDLWKLLEARGVRTASYHLDLYVGLARQELIRYDPFWRTGTVFTADGDAGTARELERWGINHRWLPAAVVSDEAHVGSARAEYTHDVVFVGSSASYHPEWPWRRTLIRLLQKRYGARFGLYGHAAPVRGQDLNDLYASAKVVVGDTLALPGHTHYWSDRYYETVGRGGFLIAPWVAGIDEHFTNGDDLRYYYIGEEQRLVDMIDHYLDHLDEADAIAMHGLSSVRANHTYRHRVQTMLHELKLDE